MVGSGRWRRGGGWVKNSSRFKQGDRQIGCSAPRAKAKKRRAGVSMVDVGARGDQPLDASGIVNLRPAWRADKTQGHSGQSGLARKV